jgi:5-formyltetrahydrofolate cyclo-ligase
MEADAAKQALRREGWERLREAGAARFPGVVGRIPNFVGAEAAAQRFARSAVFRAAQTFKCNPDSPQRPARAAALRAGKRVYMAVPRLAEAEPFLELDPIALGPGALWRASSIKGALELGRPVALAQMPRVDCILTGCVGVGRDGARLGKGGGYSDLEYGLLREHGKVVDATPIVTTLHPSQLWPRGAVPHEPHDIGIDVAFLPTTTVRLPRVYPRPVGILWQVLDPARRAAIPVLR